MGFFDEAQGMLGKGVSAARGVVSGVALESFGFVRAFVRMCDDGWQQGWHERNGGNASYLLSPEEVASARSFFNEAPGDWVPLGACAPQLASAFFLVTAAGSFMRNVSLDPDRAVGIVEMGPTGETYRVVWGLRDSGRPTSEFAGHVLIHEARLQATGGASRVLYHAHPVAVVALLKLDDFDARTLTQLLWRTMTECVMVFPDGVGVVGCKVPGSLELARASAEQMQRRCAVAWAHHGLLSSGVSFDDAFGRMHAIVKACEIHLAARAASGGSRALRNEMSIADVLAIAEGLGLELAPDLL